MLHPSPSRPYRGRIETEASSPQWRVPQPKEVNHGPSPQHHARRMRHLLFPDPDGRPFGGNRRTGLCPGPMVCPTTLLRAYGTPSWCVAHSYLMALLATVRAAARSVHDELAALLRVAAGHASEAAGRSAFQQVDPHGGPEDPDPSCLRRPDHGSRRGLCPNGPKTTNSRADWTKPNIGWLATPRLRKC
jgi:hypothetical protein